MIYHLTTNNGYVPWCAANDAFGVYEVSYSKTPSSIIVEPDEWCTECRRMAFNMRGIELKTIKLNSCYTGFGDCSGLGCYHLEKKRLAWCIMSKKLNLVCGPDNAGKLQRIIGYDVLFPVNSEPGVIELSGPDECWSFIRSIYEGGMVVRVEKHYDWPDDITCFCSDK